MGTGASKENDKSINALMVKKAMQRPAVITNQSENNSSALDQKPTMPVAKAQNGQATLQTSTAVKSDVEQLVTPIAKSQQANIPKDVPKVATGGAAAVPTLAKKKSDSDDEGAEEEKGNAASEEKPMKVLTEEEMQQQIDTFYETLSTMISLWNTIPVKDSNQELETYTQEFRSFVLKLAKSYFHFKPGKYPYSFVRDFRLKAGKHLADSKCVSHLCDVIVDALKRQDFLREEGKTNILFYLPVKNCLLTLLNFSDLAREVKLAIGSHPDLISSLVAFVTEWKDEYLRGKLSDNLNKFIKWAVSIFHNVGGLDENVPNLREKGVIEVILPLLDSPVSTMRLASLSTLADIVNEEEAELLQAKPSVFKFLLKTLRLSLDDVSHKDLGWSAEELTRAVKQLARNDANKKILVDLGCLPILTSLLKIGSDMEIKETLECLWILSFNEGNKKAMMTECNLVDQVIDEYNNCSGTMKYTCQGLLWSLKDHLMTDDKYKTVGSEVCTFNGQQGIVGTTLPESPQTPEGKGFKGHVMISYQWANQETIKHIAHEMRANDIPIWLDIDYMGGSTLQAMAKAVENSFVVIVAMSQKYKDSPNTRAEAEYAFQQRKKIIPLMMQKSYRPDGWLGLILGSKLFYDFSGKYSFESRMTGLLKAIHNIQNAVEGTDPEQPVMTMKKSAVLTSPTKPVAKPVPRKENEIKAWKSVEVMQWLVKFKLDKVDSMTKLSGEEILFLFKLKLEAPEFFYRCLETKLCLESLLDLSRASDAISGLDL